MPQARFQTNLGAPVIDEEAGIIRGCRIATLGAVSTSARDEGCGLEMDSTAIDGLLTLANSTGKLSSFFTHAWFESEEDPLTSDVGIFQNFQLDSGNLVADFHAFETSYKPGIFSRVKTDASSIAISPIFDYEVREGAPNKCNPTKFISADFVKYGAINRALLKQTTKQAMADDNATPDFLTQLAAALKDPTIHAAIKAMVKENEPADDDVTEMEQDAGVMDSDKKDGDEQKPALMRAVLRSGRALSRQRGELKSSVLTEIRGELKTLAKAEATALLGKVPGINLNIEAPNAENDPKIWIETNIKNGTYKTVAAAKLAMGRKQPKLYAQLVG